MCEYAGHRASHPTKQNAVRNDARSETVRKRSPSTDKATDDRTATAVKHTAVVLGDGACRYWNRRSGLPGDDQTGCS